MPILKKIGKRMIQLCLARKADIKPKISISSYIASILSDSLHHNEASG